MLPPKSFEDCQRVQVIRQGNGPEQVVKITVERYNQCLGWYTAGSIAIPQHQLPLLQQALDELSVPNCTECPSSECPECPSKIVPFPGLNPEKVAELNAVDA
jgi:hypothetical protein